MKDIKDQIREMELKKRKNISAELKVSFDSWYHIRSKIIPVHHPKEAILADFKSRGLKSEETIATFDKALRQYGVNF